MKYNHALVFHGVKDRHLGMLAANESMFEFAEKFDFFLDELTRSGWRFAGLSDFLEARSKPKSKLIHITFDDGYIDNYYILMPLLAGKNIPYSVFVTTRFIEGEKPWWLCLDRFISESESTYDWNEQKWELSSAENKNKFFLYARKFFLDQNQDALNWLNCLKEDGDFSSQRFFMDWDILSDLNKDQLVTIGAHTKSHPNLTRLSFEDAYLEMELSKKEIEEKIGQEVQYMAYPYGGEGEISDRIANIARKIGYRAAFTTCFGFSGPEVNLFMHPRISVDISSVNYNGYIMNKAVKKNLSLLKKKIISIF